MDLRDYLLLVARNWIILAATVVVGLVTAGIYILVATPMYESSAQVVFSAHNVETGQDLAYAGNYVQSRIQTYKDLATSPTVMKAALASIGSDESARELAKRTDVQVSQLNTVVKVAVKDPSAKESEVAANAVAASLIDAVTGIETGKAQKAVSPTVEGVVVGPAEVETKPADPNKLFALAAGLIAGLLIGFGVVSVRRVVAGDPQTTAANVPEDR